ncbi:septum formation initiator family protein [Kocuria rhizophila]|uniref:FtsB family cell division protein n=1 Tax=Kocuria rhizophila TaxID=72000 RepID=UPI001ABEB2CF|nr:septum formation initiator family protein [Kocuria rhizophila]MBO4144330.1 septum formation initiator family protein [Kocuria rhizophila]MDN3225852.1 septum formation initiator family protein [Kocuria rhizophila]QTK31053.1 septum formation initiator family protein [Kocuria rhizophila]
MVGPRPRIPRRTPRPAQQAPRTERPDPRRDAAPRPERSAGGSSTLAAPTPAHSFNGRLVALVVVATLIVFLAAPTAKIFLDQRTQISELQASIAHEEQRQQELKREERLWGDDAYVEQQARERMSYVKPGESAYVVLGGQQDLHQAPESSAEQVEAGKPAWADGLWQSVLDSAYPQEDITLEPQPDESSEK